MSRVNFEAKLPDELWLAILAQCDTPTKLACSLSNRRLMRLTKVNSLWPPIDEALPQPFGTPLSRKEQWCDHLRRTSHLALVVPRETLLPQKRADAREVYRTDAYSVEAFIYAKEQVCRLDGLNASGEGQRIAEECLFARKLWNRQQRAVNEVSVTSWDPAEERDLNVTQLPFRGRLSKTRPRGFSS